MDTPAQPREWGLHLNAFDSFRNPELVPGLSFVLGPFLEGARPDSATDR